MSWQAIVFGLVVLGVIAIIVFWAMWSKASDAIKHDLQNANSDRQPIVTPCPYCHNAPRQKNLILTPTEDSFIRIVYMEGNKLVLEDRNMIKKVKIKYCSMCGRKL